MMTGEALLSPVESWGRSIRGKSRIEKLHDRFAALPAHGRPFLPFGNGRSYGDVCLNEGGTLLHTRGLDRFIAFDAGAGILRCEAGVLLSDAIELIRPRGWFLPVTPGTKFVTVGGAIANDVHGKNHHRAGSFGCHVRAFELLRSDGTRLLCMPGNNAEWFAATIGGLGLTGLITWAELQLVRFPGPWFDVETVRFTTLDEFAALSADVDPGFEYTAAWFDCLRVRRGRLPGLFIRANPRPLPPPQRERAASRLAMPFSPPFSLIGRWSLRAFNAAYSQPWRRSRWRNVQHYEALLFPLDGVQDWNRIYGSRGFYQFQCVVPGQAALAVLLERVAASGEGSFLAVLKAFGERTSPGLMSFPRLGVTLALDFPNRGARTLALLDDLAEIVAEHDGAIYPAKDARMSAAHFRRFFPRRDEFAQYVDPGFSSSFWRRVGGT